MLSSVCDLDIGDAFLSLITVYDLSAHETQDADCVMLCMNFGWIGTSYLYLLLGADEVSG
jgi:hypothetical protein